MRKMCFCSLTSLFFDEDKKYKNEDRSAGSHTENRLFTEVGVGYCCLFYLDYCVFPMECFVGKPNN